MPQLKTLVIAYQSTPIDENFNEIYYAVINRLNNSARNLAHRYRLNLDDVESEAHFVLMKAAADYDVTVGEFEPYLLQQLKYAVMNMHRQLTRSRTRDTTYADSAPTLIEHEEEIAVTKKEQSALLNELITNASIESRQALEAYAISTSYREAAKLIGVRRHETVKSRIEKIGASNREIKLADYITA